MQYKVLVSSIALPPTTFGSWTNRIMSFQRRKEYFDFVLSPTTEPTERFIFTKKKELNLWEKASRRRAEKIYREYLKELRNIAQAGHALQILVVDDRTLLEAIVSIKPNLPKGTQIYYSHHGHSLPSNNFVFDQVDKVFFLTESGYKQTLLTNYQFTPEVFIVGNGVVGEEFSPLSNSEKKKQREKFGLSENDLVISWMANSRPVKGLHIFRKVMEKIIEIHPEIKIISIGHDPIPTIDNENWLQVGKIPNEKLPEYLRLSDVYFFTSLWQEGFGLSLAEAVKCGNWAISSKIGGIPHVLEGVENSILVERPNVVADWVEAFDLYLKERNRGIKAPDKAMLDQLHSYSNWETRFFNALQS